LIRKKNRNRPSNDKPFVLTAQSWYVMDDAVTDEPTTEDGVAVHEAASVQADLKDFIESRRLKR